MRYYTRPIEAYQLNKNYCSNTINRPYWIVQALQEDKLRVIMPYNCPVHMLVIKSKMIAVTGDWIIRDTQGELSVCKQNIFEATYKAL